MRDAKQIQKTGKQLTTSLYVQDRKLSSKPGLFPYKRHQIAHHDLSSIAFFTHRITHFKTSDLLDCQAIGPFQTLSIPTLSIRLKDSLEFPRTPERERLDGLVQQIQALHQLIDIIIIDFDDILAEPFDMEEVSERFDRLAEAKKLIVHLLERVDDSFFDEKREEVEYAYAAQEGRELEAREPEVGEEARNEEVEKETPQQEVVEEAQPNGATEGNQQQGVAETEVPARPLDQHLDDIQATLRTLTSTKEEMLMLSKGVEKAGDTLVLIMLVLLLVVWWIR
ncbi:hypothetical protein BU16DRAFT_535032 [Lophium mytilinum]|uniref:Uncharacterized protein n=1 Tax=Lophium mytilinum TaxID=390894 RepID=A0A6A6R9G4_9PEZI|nr:hypothetical protein BU16DRAFT_535032 [Lophium mytilinum]